MNSWLDRLRACYACSIVMYSVATCLIQNEISVQKSKHYCAIKFNLYPRAVPFFKFISCSRHIMTPFLKTVLARVPICVSKSTINDALETQTLILITWSPLGIRITNLNSECLFSSKFLNRIYKALDAWALETWYVDIKGERKREPQRYRVASASARHGIKSWVACRTCHAVSPVRPTTWSGLEARQSAVIDTRPVSGVSTKLNCVISYIFI